MIANMNSQNYPIFLYDRQYDVLATERQCDCACVTALPAQSEPTSVMDSSQLFVLNENCNMFPLIDGYHVMLERAVKPSVANDTTLMLASHFQQPSRLNDIPATWRQVWGDEVITAAVEQMVDWGLILPEDRKPTVLTETAQTLTAWLHITDRCNLRCAYCYLPHQRVDMSAETGRAAIDATVRSAVAHGYQAIKLKYAGGEPLLRFALIAELHKYALATTQRYGLKLDGVILSNGTLLTVDMVQAIQLLGLRLMISLDGLGAVHDRQRPLADGCASSTRVRNGIELALAQGLTPEISVTVSSRNADGLAALLAWILEHNLPFSLNFYRENDLSMSHADLQLEEQHIIDGMIAAYKVIEQNLPSHSLLASLADFANLATPHLRTCSAGHSYIVFDYQGQVAKCQMALTQTITTVYADDPLALIRADLIGIQNPSVEEKEGCKGCLWKYWCAGGCPLSTFRATGRYDVKSPNCHIYKALYPEVVRLEGLRLLRDAGLLVQ